MITIFVPLLMLSVLFLIYNNYKLNTDYKIYAESANEKIANTFDSIIEDVDDALFSLQSNNDVEKFFFFKEYPQFAENRETLSEISDALNINLNASSHIESIYIYNNDMSYLKGTNLNNFKSKLIDNNWYSLLEANEFNDYILMRKGKYALQDTYYLTICRNVYVSKDYLGSYVFNIVPNVITNVLKVNEDVETILIKDDNDNVLYCNHPDFFSEKQDEVIAEYKDKLQFSSKSKYGFTVQSSVSKSMYEERLSFYTAIVALIFILILICAIVTSFILSRYFYKSIVNIIGILQQSETENYDFKKENEYEFIRRSILSIRDNKNSIEAELAEKLALLKTYQLRTLQNQINPHFLNNTLNLIGLLDVAEHKKQTKIYKLIKLLSDLLSGVTDTNEYIVPLSTELEYTQKYLDIQNIKYNNKFTININAEQNILKTPVLKFMLQPIVENAIIHGILGAGEKEGYITIDAFMQNNFLTICVKNSGNVIVPEKLEELQQNLTENVQPESKHIGLLNVNQRLNLVFGKTSSCNIMCDYDEITTSVIISIPSKKFDI